MPKPKQPMPPFKEGAPMKKGKVAGGGFPVPPKKKGY